MDKKVINDLRAMVLPDLRFESASIADAVQYLRQQYQEVYGTALRVSVNLSTETLQRRITAEFRDTTLWDIFEFVSRMGLFKIFVSPSHLFLQEGTWEPIVRLRERADEPDFAEELSAPLNAENWSPTEYGEEVKLIVQPGTASPEEIAEILARLSRLYRKVGGTGISYRIEGTTINERELV